MVQEDPFEEQVLLFTLPGDLALGPDGPGLMDLESKQKQGSPCHHRGPGVYWSRGEARRSETHFLCSFSASLPLYRFPSTGIINFIAVR